MRDHLVDAHERQAGANLLIDGRTKGRHHHHEREKQVCHRNGKREQRTQEPDAQGRNNRCDNGGCHTPQEHPHENDHEGTPAGNQAAADLDATLLWRGIDAPRAQPRPLKCIAKDGERPHDGHEHGNGKHEDGLDPPLVSREQFPRVREILGVLHWSSRCRWYVSSVDNPSRRQRPKADCSLWSPMTSDRIHKRRNKKDPARQANRVLRTLAEREGFEPS